ncbi:MAG: GGDEF domain-containing protein [Arcobacteraceae bacterium]
MSLKAEIVKNIFTKNILRCYVVIVSLIILSSYFIGKKVLMPFFYEHMIKMAISENQKISEHIFMHASIQDSNISLNEELSMLKDNFQLQKIKFFDTQGVVLASTQESDIGQHNQEQYFINHVKKGEVFFKIIHKNTLSLENEYIEKDVAEIYFPMFQDEKLFGVIEIYYDITQISGEFDKIIKKIDSIYFIAVFAFFLFFSFILYRLSIADLNRKKNEEEIFQLNETLQEKVRKRTFQLLKKNKQLKKLANFDSLTGVYNRGFFLNLASKYFDIAKRNLTSLYIISFDLDHFKNINDAHGHATGDEVLKEFTSVVSSYMRNSDLFGRIGGEEFVACIQNVKDEGAILFAQKICDAINHAKIEFNDKRIHLTVSIGIAKLTTENNIDELIEKSDKAMYEAKESGRNKVIFYKEA